ncbi:MAG: hypothetical protein Q8P82_00390 [bacterium]|nr:hypothetical protein [bacterium]
MSLRSYLLFVAFGTIVSGFTSFVVLRATNPNEAGFFAFLLVYLSLGITVIGIGALAGFGIRMLRYRHEGIVLREVATAFRQACLFSVVVIGSIILQTHSLLTWWNALLFVVGVTLLEWFFIAARFSR